MQITRERIRQLVDTALNGGVRNSGEREFVIGMMETWEENWKAQDQEQQKRGQALFDAEVESRSKAAVEKYKKEQEEASQPPKSDEPPTETTTPPPPSEGKQPIGVAEIHSEPTPTPKGVNGKSK